MRRWLMLAACAVLATATMADSAVGPGASPDTDTTGTFPFRRISEPVMVAIGPAAQMTAVPASTLTNPNTGLPLTTFHVANPNKVWVRLKGYSAASDCSNPNTGVTPTTGWLWPPGYVGVYSTQFPMCVSAMAVPEPGYPLDSSVTYAPLELSYGTGQ